MYKFFCWLFTGHNYTKHYEADRIYMECMNCGAVTLGWAVEEAQNYRPTARVWDQHDYNEIYDHLQETEWSLHWGG